LQLQVQVQVQVQVKVQVQEAGWEPAKQKKGESRRPHCSV
jgi:hypothetical protein